MVENQAINFFIVEKVENNFARNKFFTIFAPLNHEMYGFGSHKDTSRGRAVGSSSGS